MNKLFYNAGSFLLIAVLIICLSACGLPGIQSAPTPTPTPSEEVKTVEIETPPPSPTPTPTPTPSVPPVAVTTVPMPMPSVTPTVGVTTTPDPNDPNATPVPSPTVSPDASASPSPSPTDTYSPDAEFASTIQPDSVTIPENAIAGYINANGVNFRGGPSSSAKIIDTLALGTNVAILGIEGSWAEILVNGISGYVRSEYISRGTSGAQPAIGGGNDYGGTVIVPNSTPTPFPNNTDPFGGTPIG